MTHKEQRIRRQAKILMQSRGFGNLRRLRGRPRMVHRYLLYGLRKLAAVKDLF